MVSFKTPHIGPKQRWLLLALYILGIAIVFLYYLFPTDTFGRYLTTELNRLSPEVRMTIGRTKPIFPPGVGCFDVTIYHRQEVLASNAIIAVHPHWSSLLGLSKKARFSANLLGGQLEGTFRLQAVDDPSEFEVAAQFSGIAVEKIQAAQSLIKRSVQGKLNGQMVAKRKNRFSETYAQLTLLDAKVGIAIPGVDITNLIFDKLKADLLLKGSKLEVQRCDFSGNQINGKVTGTIMVREPLGNSRLRLRATFKAAPAIIAQLEQTTWGPLLAQLQSQPEGLSVRLRGSINLPSVSLR